MSDCPPHRARVMARDAFTRYVHSLREEARQLRQHRPDQPPTTILTNEATANGIREQREAAEYHFFEFMRWWGDND